MKKNYLWSVILLMAGAFITSCNKDKIEGPDDNGIAGEGNVILKVHEGAQTRAYIGEEPADADESTLASTVAVLVYDASGALDYSNLSLPVDINTGKTSPFKVPPGYKYFYVFSNGQVTTPPAGSHYKDMEKQIARVTFVNDIPQPIAVSGAMTLGTLWNDRDPFDVQGDGYGGQPVQVGAKVGRATAKIRVLDIKKETLPNKPSTLAGDFSDPSYRLRSVADRYYVVGQLDDSGDYPPTIGLRYISAVHEEGPGTSAIPSDAFVDYTWAGAKIPGQSTHFYAVENTTKQMPLPGNNIENLYYGNTTYVQFRITYAPAGSEVYNTSNLNTPTGNAITAGTTFWTAVYANNGTPVRLIFEDDPTGVTDMSDVKEYENGVVYYKFPVRDKTESGTERQCCVIRNHYYMITVDSIKDLGEPTDEVDPWTPIDPIDPDVEITIEVLDWFKVETHEDV